MISSLVRGDPVQWRRGPHSRRPAAAAPAAGGALASFRSGPRL